MIDGCAAQDALAERGALVQQLQADAARRAAYAASSWRRAALAVAVFLLAAALAAAVLTALCTHGSAGARVAAGLCRAAWRWSPLLWHDARVMN